LPLIELNSLTTTGDAFFLLVSSSLEIHEHPVGVPLRRVVALDGGVDLEPGLPVQRHRGRPRRVDVEDHPLYPPPSAPLHGRPQQSLAVALPSAALPHCDQRLQFRARIQPKPLPRGTDTRACVSPASSMMVAQREVLQVYTAYPATSSPPAPGVE
jgi:hypothetical protein